MDLNTILFIAVAVMMLFCCGGLGRLFSRRENGGDHCGQSKEASGDASTTAATKSGSAKRSGCCH